MECKFPENWMRMCLASFEMPGSPWKQIELKILENLAENFDHSRNSVELSHTLQLLGKNFDLEHALNSNEETKQSKRNFYRRSQLKTMILRAANDTGCRPEVDKTCQTDACIKLIEFIKNSLNSAMNLNLGTVRMTATLSNTLEFESKSIQFLGATLAQILQKDPSKLPNVKSRVAGRILPSSLRKVVYHLTLINKHQISQDVLQAEQEMRLNFANSVKAGMTNLGTKDPVKSPMHNLINISVIEYYETLPGLMEFANDISLQKVSSDALNILYTSSKKVMKEYALWTFPLWISIHNGYSKNHAYELSMMLNSFLMHCFPMSEQNETAVDVWLQLSKKETRSSFLIVQHFEKMGFNFDATNSKKVLEEDMVSSTSSSRYPHELLGRGKESLKMKPQVVGKSMFANSHPLICIRQWITNLFVGITDFHVTMFFWDQLFLSAWNRKTLILACLTLLNVMSNSIASQPDVDSVCSTLILKACHAQVHDVSSIWKTLQ